DVRPMESRGGFMNQQTVTETLRDALIRGDRDSVRAYAEELHAVDLADLLEEIEPTQAWSTLEMLPLETRAEVFGYFEGDFQVALADVIKRNKLAAIVSCMNSDERADLFNRLTEDQQEALLPALAQAEREDIRRLSAHDEGTAGAIMTSDYASLTPDLTARQALDKLRREAPDKETINRAFVLDAERKLVGVVRLQAVILANPSEKVSAFMERDSHAAHVNEDQEEVARAIAKYDVVALPVLDDDGRLVGIVTHDDAIDVLQEEATEDFQKIATVGKINVNMRDAGMGLLYRKRISWLILLIFGNLLTGIGIAFFEETIATYVVLVFFMPVLVGSAGNAGSQAATLMIRALATGDVENRDWARLLGREFLVALALGLTMAVAISAVGHFRGGEEIALVVALSMVAVVMIGSLTGMSLPFLLSRLNLDPATASAPLITTIADVTGVVIYFAIATAILGLPA
ncbi:MAG: magnesium transporter, partial [Sphingomonadales bacterium]